MLLCLLGGSGGGQYREELILNVTVFVVRVWRWAIWRGTDTECYCVFLRVWRRAIWRGTDTECYCVFVRVWRRAIWRGTDTECYCVCCEGLGSAI
jgi:hypothetical protein